MKIGTRRFVTITAMLFAHSWWIMLALGGVHSMWAAVPHPGYWPVVLLLFVLHMVTMFVTTTAIFQREVLEETGIT